MVGKVKSDDLKNSLILHWQKNPNITFTDLAKVFSVDRKTATNWVEKFKKTGTVKNDTSNKGRPRKTTERQDRYMAIAVKKDPWLTAK